MGSQVIIVDDLIDEVRQLLDEDNKQSVSDTADILPALNRGQNYAANILARHYESPMLAFEEVTTVSGQQEYNIPEDAFEERLEKVEVKVSNIFYPIKRIDYRDLSIYENRNSTSIPYYYAVVENRYRIIPTSNATYPLRIWYLKDPLPLVTQQGRINVVEASSNYVVVDSVGEDLTTETDQLNSYVSIIDGHSGKRKATFQIKTISGNRITFKTSPARSNVLNTDIDTDIGNLLRNSDNIGEDFTIEPDDYLCVVKGSCVPFFKKPFSNFLVQYAVAEIRRKLGGPAELERQVLKDLEQQVERSWAGRENTLRVKKASEHWNLPVKRYWGIKS